MNTAIALASVILFLLFFIAAIRCMLAHPKLIKKLQNTEEDLENQKAALEELRKNAAPLWKYRPIHDVEKELFSIQRQIQSEKEQAEAEAKAIRKEAREEAKALREKAQSKLDSATADYKATIDRATVRAEEIAGEALAAKGKADLYQKTARAMKNIIEGYGNEYIVPARSILDKLAEDYSFKEAGQQLKAARQATKKMIKQSFAADCDYAEKHRREMAINFVIDAFNGKVDTTLTKVKHDNHGKLKQEILDAYSIVNRTGEPFKNARILPDYRDARLTELKWAVATYVLREEEKEEQRRIKEAMREEEKARREYEKAIKQAEKEEKVLKSAMDKAVQELEAASVEEKARFEAKILELKQQLAEAEEKNQRAISMAQQTRRGHVYVISNIGSFGDDVFKIGLTRRLEPMDRVRELGDASVPFAFDVHAMIFSEDAPTLETKLHRLFEEQQVNKVNSRKEFFRVSAQKLKEAIEDLNLETRWTMAAEAKEYRETLAMMKEAGSLGMN